MRKIIAMMALIASTSAMAVDSFTFEKDRVNNATTADQDQYVLTARKDINKTFTGDVAFSNVQTDGTNAIGNRIETGLTGTVPLIGTVNGLTRVAVGRRLTTTGDYNYYLVEPGVSMPVGPFTAKVSWRYRTAIDSSANNDQTHTARYALSYPVTKTDSIMIGYDRVTGDSDQKTTRIAYTVGF